MGESDVFTVNLKTKVLESIGSSPSNWARNSIKSLDMNFI